MEFQSLEVNLGSKPWRQILEVNFGSDPQKQSHPFSSATSDPSGQRFMPHAVWSRDRRSMPHATHVTGAPCHASWSSDWFSMPHTIWSCDRRSMTRLLVTQPALHATPLGHVTDVSHPDRHCFRFLPPRTLYGTRI